MRRFTALCTLLGMLLVITAAPAIAKPKPTTDLAGWAEAEVTAAAGTWMRTAAEGVGEFGVLGEDPLDEVEVLLTQRFSGWNGKDPMELEGKTMMGEITITAANGDRLFGTYRGEIDFLYVPEGRELPVVFAYAELTFRNGTGQYRDVTGSVTIDIGRCFSAGMIGFDVL